MWWAPAQTPAQVVEDPQLLANDGFVDLDGGSLRSVNGPVSFGDAATRVTPTSTVPHLGEHTDEVLAEWGHGREGSDL